MWFKSFACMYEVHIHTGCPGSQKNKCFFFPKTGFLRVALASLDYKVQAWLETNSYAQVIP